jgi:hypothetical protein
MLASSPKRTVPVTAHASVQKVQKAVKSLTSKILPLTILDSIFYENFGRSETTKLFALSDLSKACKKNVVCTFAMSCALAGVHV